MSKWGYKTDQVLYCEKCGAEMKALPDKVIGYEAGTKEEVIEVQKVCPNRRWWNYTGHSFMRWRCRENDVGWPEWKRLS